MCNQLYGGNVKALVDGRWGGKPVQTEFNRENGCQMERWDKFKTFLCQECMNE
jgi:hypothetical protein